MLRYLFAGFMLLHGLIHVMGFAKAFGYGNSTQLTKEITKAAGVFWLLAALMFIVAAGLVLSKQMSWWMAALAAVVLSQVLVFTAWQDAKYGTIANLLLLVAVVLGAGSWQFQHTYKKEVRASLERIHTTEAILVTKADLQPLPEPVQRYLTYAGVVNKPRVLNVKILFEGQMRDRGKDWFPFTSEQYNFFDVPTRLFFMKARMFGVTVPGYHAYKNGVATMQVKAFGLFPLVNVWGNELNKAETVTLFNDMCLLAPATLIDKRIRWEPVDSNTAKAVFTINRNSIAATLYFNSKGQLVNFISDDRYAIADMKQYRFSTPIRAYRKFHGFNLGSYGEAAWNYPDGPFTYGTFHIRDVVYNCR